MASEAATGSEGRSDRCSAETRLTFERERVLDGGSVEIVYSVGSAAGLPGRDAAWSPASQRSS